MDAQSQSGINFSHLRSGYDLMESAGKHWMETINRIFPESADGGEKKRMPGMSALNMWQKWYEDGLSHKKASVPDMQAWATACMDQQKHCSALGLSWCRCTVKTIQAIREGMENGDSPVKLMKHCIECSAEYARTYADFLLNWSDDFSRFIPPSFTKSEKSEKGDMGTKPEKVKGA